MTVINKEFEDINWLKLINQVKLYIEEYNLDLISLEIYKTNDKKYKYKAKVKYGLGLR